MASYAILTGFLCGYPMGAKVIADLLKSNQISKQEGQYLLAFCNNASPMFIISFVAMQCLNIKHNPFIILGIVYGSAILTGIVYRIIHSKTFQIKTSANLELTAVSCSTKPARIPAFAVLDQTILNAFTILVKVGGYIILFSILAEIVLHITFIPKTFRYFLIGFLEITTGSAAISFAQFSFTKKIVLTNALTAFGGLSSHAQTYSVIIHSGLSIKKYFLFKCINAGIAGICTLLFVITI